MDDYVLRHHGIKGMRWGIRRYQNPDGSLTKAGQRRAAREAKKEAKREAEKAEYEHKKQAALKSGSASEVLKYKGDLSKQEMESAISRIRWEQEMSRISNSEVTAGKKRVDKFFSGVDDASKKLDTVITATNTSLKAWNTVANIVNAFGKNDISLPRVDLKNTTGNREVRKQEQKKLEKEKEKEKGADE